MKSALLIFALLTVTSTAAKADNCPNGVCPNRRPVAAAIHVVRHRESTRVGFSFHPVQRARSFVARLLGR